MCTSICTSVARLVLCLDYVEEKNSHAYYNYIFAMILCYKNDAAANGYKVLEKF